MKDALDSYRRDRSRLSAEPLAEWRPDKGPDPDIRPFLHDLADVFGATVPDGPTRSKLHELADELADDHKIQRRRRAAP